MSQFFPTPAGLVVGLSAAIILATVAPGTSDLVLAAVGVVGFIVGVAAWLASPLPNGTMMMGGGGGSGE